MVTDTSPLSYVVSVIWRASVSVESSASSGPFGQSRHQGVVVETDLENQMQDLRAWGIGPNTNLCMAKSGNWSPGRHMTGLAAMLKLLGENSLSLYLLHF